MQFEITFIAQLTRRVVAHFNRGWMEGKNLSFKTDFLLRYPRRIEVKEIFESGYNQERNGVDIVHFPQALPGNIKVQERDTFLTPFQY